MNQTDLKTFLAECREIVNCKLGELVPAATIEPQFLHEAIRWSLLGGGKRFRPALMLAVGAVFGAENSKLLQTAAALEMIHTYSLIHDDLPAMDDDDLRRGLPTCHVKFDEATAILAGDALQTLAFQAIAEDGNLTAEVRVRLISEISRAAGTPIGMIAGQVLDLEGETSMVTGAQLEKIHNTKTGAIIRAAARCGAIIGSASENELNLVSTYAAHLGLLFQITDDLLDVTATAEDFGKTPGKDARAEKATYPALYGLNEAQKLAVQTHRKCLDALEEIEKPFFLLGEIADYILFRKA
ncbi:MAG: polyprenyl synthetase family protein [Pyrinomonadaceae bacterium]